MQEQVILTSNEEFVTINSVYERLTGNVNLSNTLMGIGNAKERINYLCGIADTIGVHGYRNYLNLIMQVDLLIKNVDRHTNNFGFIRECGSNKFRLAPIFDNGASLNTTGTYGTACTISGSFEEQVTAFHFPIRKMFSINFNKLKDTINEFENRYGNTKEINTLVYNIQKYGDIFK